MAEILDEQEVGALLDDAEAEANTAGSTADGPTDGVAGGSEEGAVAAVHLYSRRLGGLQQTDISIGGYDFKSPERVSKDQMHALEHLHEGFARNFGAALSGFLRTIVECRVSSISQMTFREFTTGLPSPTCFNLFSAAPLEGQVCLEISPLIIYPVIDRLLGGSNADLFIPQRPLTAIELRLVDRILAFAVGNLDEAWSGVLPVTFKLEETESNPALVQIVPPNEVVVVIQFELKMGNRSGTMSLCIPYAVIEPVMEKLNNQAWSSYRKTDHGHRHRTQISGHLEAAKLQVAAVLAETRISVGDLAALEVGDIILTDMPSGNPLSLDINGRRKFIGQLGQFKGKRAFAVDRASSPRDRR